MKVGIKRYEGEVYLWNLPMGCKPTFCHIIARVEEELRRARSEGAPFYPFGLTTTTTSILEEFDDKYGAINIYFVPVKNEIDDWEFGFPEPNLINWDYSGKRCTTIKIKDGEVPIPDPVRLWSSGKYPALLIDKIKTYKKKGITTLDCIGAPCRNFSTKKPIEISLSRWVSFGVFENKETTPKCERLVMDVVAKAKLVPPYLGVAI